MESYFNNDVSPEFKQHMENPLVNLEKSLLDLEKRELAKHCQKHKDKEFLDWLADRLENVYKESPNTDFVIRLRKIAKNYLENN